MEQYQFAVYYDGENLEEHVMDARSVAKSIDSFVTLFSEINKTVHSEISRPSIKLQLIGTNHTNPEAFEAGSFGWNFKFISDTTGKAAELVKVVASKASQKYGEPAAIFSELCELLKKINGRDIEIQRDKEGTYTLKIDNESIEIDEHKASLLANDKIQDAMKKIVSPLHTPGINKFGISDTVHDKENSLVTVSTGEEANSFKGSKASLIPKTQDIERDIPCYIDTLSYNPTSPWKLVSEQINDNKPFTVTINDAAFLNRVAAKDEPFAKSDILIVRLYEKHVYNPVSGKVKSTYIVQEVLEHKMSAKQPHLFD